MNYIEVSVDSSFSHIWGQEDIDLNLKYQAEYNNISEDEVDFDYRLKRTEVILTTTSNLAKYKPFRGMIFCYQDELLDISSYLKDGNICSFPKTFTPEDVKSLVRSKMNEWLKSQLEIKMVLLANNLKVIKKYLHKETRILKETEIKSYLKLEKAIEDGSFNEGVLPICSRKMKLLKLSETELVKHTVSSSDFIVNNKNDSYWILSISDTEKWVERNMNLIILVIDLLEQRSDAEGIYSQTDIFILSALEAFPFPLVLLGPTQEIIFSNHQFSNLNISFHEITNEYKEMEQIKIGVKLYHQKRFMFSFDNKNYEGCLLLEQNKEIKDMSFYSDLGIICSSLAHELRNPLAGILAALNVLELSDSLDQEALDYLDKMKETTLRAKDLIDTFLGFSRVELKGRKELNNFLGKKHNLEFAFKQASALIKERVIESQLDIKFHFIKKIDTSMQMNESVMLMIFYLIFNEVITSFTHQRLIAKIDQEITVLCTENENELSIQIDPWVKNIENHKLVSHLINMQSMRVELDKDKILLKKV